MDASFFDNLSELIPAFLSEAWDLVSDPVRRRQYGVDKLLHFSISFFMAACLVLPWARWRQRSDHWIWIVMVPGILKEIWDFYKKVYIHHDWAHYPEVFQDSMFDLVFDVLGILSVWLLFCRKKN